MHCLFRLSIVACLAALSGSAPLAAQVAADDSIADVIRTSGERHVGARVVLSVERGALSAEQSGRFLAALDTGIAELERLLGRSLDRAHYTEDTIQVFVADGIGVSHVYGGYAHPRHRRPYLYLDAARVRANEAPYLHELTHILVWRFGSHSLREGVASWAESELIARGVSSGNGLFDASGGGASVHERAAELTAAPGAPEVLPAIGRVGMPDRALTSAERPRMRSAYYVMSQSFAQFLVETLGLPTVLRLYEGAATDGDYVAIAGRTLEDLHGAWLTGIGARTPAGSP